MAMSDNGDLADSARKESGAPASDGLATQLLERYPALGKLVAWISVATLVLGYLSTALGHAEKIKQLLFEKLGAGSLLSVHQLMIGVTLVLLVTGYAALSCLVWRRYIAVIPQPGRRLAFSGALAGVAVGLLTVSALAAMPAPPEAGKLLAEEQAQWRRELLNLHNRDGGLRWSRVDLTVESQAWTTAQVLAAVLSSNQALDDQQLQRARAAFEFIDQTLLKTPGEGWGYFAYVPWGVTEINAWVCVALAKSLGGAHATRLWRDELPLARQRLRQCAQLIVDRQMNNGGWAPVNKKDNPRFSRTYSSLMALWSLLEVRRVLEVTSYDDYIRAGTSWLLQQYDARHGGWVPNPDRKAQLESFPGLTAQIVYVLTLLPELFRDTLAQGDFDEIKVQVDRWIEGGPFELRSDYSISSRPVAANDRTHDSDRYLPQTGFMIEGSTFLWYPWLLAACVRLHPPEAADGGCKRLASRANELVRFAKDESITYVMAESLLALQLSEALF
jgi:hypothetical protein